VSGLAALAVLLMASGCQRGTDDGGADRAADEAAVRALLGGIVDDFNAGRIEAMLGRYQDDVVVSAPGAPDIAGKEAWRQALATSLPPGMPMKLRFDTAELEIAGDLAYERGTYAIEIGDPANTAQLMTIPGRHIHIFRRQPDGTWKGWRLFENSEDPATSPIPPPAAAE
jgi:ketosteroid isomerase-like protein